MKRLLFLVVCLMLGEISLFAQHRSESEAIQIAQEFFGMGEKKKAMKLSVVPPKSVELQIKKKISPAKKVLSTTPSFYVVNDDENNRFVIVSSDERMYQILGYSSNGTFDAEKIPLVLFEILDGYDRQYDLLLNHTESIGKIKPRRTTTPAIEPLIKTKWGQGTPYNDECPVNKRASDGSKCYSGCVATAMAQVMNYYKYPSKGIGSYAYISATQKHIQSFDFGNTTFDWGKMVNVYGNEATKEQKSEVAKLMHACGVAVSMDYGDSSDGQSGASPYDIAYAMINYFGYNPNTVFKMKDYYSSEEWNSIIMQELEAGRPMLYGGRGTGGHRFILDGCDEKGLYHFNFGWTVPGYSVLDGYGNGYYSLDAIRPQDVFLNILSEEEVDLGNFSNEQSLVCQISPNTIGNHEDVFYATSFNISASSSVKVGTSVNCWFRATNYSSSTSSTDNKSEKFKGEVGIGLYDTSWNFIKSLYSENFSKHSYESAWVDHDVTLDASSFNSGKQYFIAPFAKAAISETPTRIRANYGKGWYLAEVDGGNIVLTKNGEPEHIEYPPIPTGTIYASASGAGDKQVSDTNEKPTTWQLTLTKDPNEPAMYWLDNFEPSVSGNSNRVYGYIDKAGSQISIPIGQKIGENLSITNYSSSGDIIVNVSSVDSTMIITDAWGTIEMSSSGDNTTSKQLSLYSTTNFSFKPFPTPEPEPDPVVIVSKPLITVNDAKMMSIACSTDGAEIHYTLDGNDPIESSTVYSKAIQLTGNCTIKAIAFLDGRKSETDVYDEKGFVVSKPNITQPTESEIEISCIPNDAQIFYTTDGTIPTDESTHYTGIFPVSESCVIKAFGIKDGYTDSDVATFIYTKPGGELVIDNNIAGYLPSRISENEKVSTKGLIVSGNLNGTDIAFIREMIIDGNLTSVDLQNSNIVEGGNPYYVSSRDYSTTNNTIGKYMFAKCKNLYVVRLPNTVTSIEGEAFDNCDNLKELMLPESCESVDNFAFNSCDNLESITINKKLNSFGRINGHRCPQLKSIYVDDNSTYFCSIDGVLYSKDESRLVRFPMGKDVENYTISNKTTEVCDYAMSHCSANTITIPNSVSIIGGNSFEYCDNIESVIIPNSVTSIGSSAFDSCKGLVSVELSSNVEEIPSFAFSYCPNLRNFTIGAKVKKISEYAFSRCASLQAFVVDASNEIYCSYNGTIYSKDMKNLIMCPNALYTSNYRIPDGVNIISNQAFANCQNIQSFSLPSTLSVIGKSAFKDCEMTSIVIPENVTVIGESAFENCKKLETLAIPEGIKRVENWLAYNCDNLSYLNLPSTVEYIGLSAFASCDSLKMIDSAIRTFNNIELRVSSIDNSVSAFKDISNNCTWRVPYGTAEVYKSQPWWVETWSIIEDNPVVSYNVFVGTSGYATFSAWNSAFLPEGLRAFVVTKVDDTTATLTEVPNMGKGIGYVLKGIPNTNYIINIVNDEDEIDYSYADSNLMVAAPDGADIGQDGKDYILADDGNGEAKFFLSEPGRIGNNKAYLRYTSDAASLSLRIDGTGIAERLEEETPKAYYDLQGRPVMHPKRGLFIFKGKKMIFK